MTFYELNERIRELSLATVGVPMTDEVRAANLQLKGLIRQREEQRPTRRTGPVAKITPDHILARFGVDTDAAIARDMGLSRARVCQIRKARGIPAVPHKGRSANIIPDHILARFGVDTDAAIARDMGVTRERVRQIRKAHGIKKASRKRRAAFIETCEGGLTA